MREESEQNLNISGVSWIMKSNWSMCAALSQPMLISLLTSAYSLAIKACQCQPARKTWSNFCTCSARSALILTRKNLVRDVGQYLLTVEKTRSRIWWHKKFLEALTSAWSSSKPPETAILIRPELSTILSIFVQRIKNWIRCCAPIASIFSQSKVRI